LPTPAWDGRPQLRQEWAWVYDGFLVLSKQRQAGFGANPISVADVCAYLDLAGIRETGQRMVFLELVIGLDEIARQWHGQREHSGRNAKPQN